jgi:hypothetical protein
MRRASALGRKLVDFVLVAEAHPHLGDLPVTEMANDNLLPFHGPSPLLETNDVEHDPVFVAGEDVMVLEAWALVVDLAEETKYASELLLPVVIASSRISSGRVNHDIIRVVTKEPLQISSHQSVGAATEDFFVGVRHRSSLPLSVVSRSLLLPRKDPCLEAVPRTIDKRPISRAA